MRLFNRLPQVWSANALNTGHNRPIPNTKQHAFKPKAIRAPALLSLFFLFTICLAWLEILLNRTVKASEYYKLHGINDGLKKRLVVPPGQCPAPEINAQNLVSLRSKHSELCSSYTTVFKPETTDLPPPMQTSFDEWLAIYSSMEALSELAENCALSQFSSSALSSIINSLTSQSTVASPSVSGTSSSSLLGATSAAAQTSQSLSIASTTVDKITLTASNSNTADTGPNTFASTRAQFSFTSSVTMLPSRGTSISNSVSPLPSNVSQQSSSLLSSAVTSNPAPGLTSTTDTDQTLRSASTTTPLTIAVPDSSSLSPPVPTASTVQSSSSSVTAQFSSSIVTPAQTSASTSVTSSDSITEATAIASSGTLATLSSSSRSRNATGSISPSEVSTSQGASQGTTASTISTTIFSASSKDSVELTKISNVATTPVDTLVNTTILEISTSSPITSINITTSDTIIATLEESGNTTTPESITTTSETPTNVGVSGDTITTPATTTNSTVPANTTPVPETTTNTTVPDITTTAPETSTNTTISGGSNTTPETTTNITLSQDTLTTPLANTNTTSPTNTSTTSERTTNTTTSEVTTSTPPTGNSMVCEEVNQSCDECDASICTCQASYASKRADLSCSADPCACQQDPSNSSHIECGNEVNICNDICTGPFTPEGEACFTCESESCFCQDSVCSVNTTQTTQETQCVSGETCSSCEAEKCICESDPSLTLFRRIFSILAGRDNSVCGVDQCFCSYDEDLSEWQCGDIDYCDNNSTASTTSSLEPTSGSQTNESVSQPPSTLSNSTTPPPESISPNTSTPGTITSTSMTFDSTTPSTTPSDINTPNTTTPSSTTSDSMTTDSATPDSTTSDTITSSSSTVTPVPCTPGAACDSCSAGICSCSSFPTIGASCVVDTCSCSRQSSTWQCNTINLCTPTSTTATSTTSAEEPDPSRSCQPGSPCSNCGASSCYCRDDGFCDVNNDVTSSCDNCTKRSTNRIRRDVAKAGFLVDAWSEGTHQKLPHAFPRIYNVTDPQQQRLENNKRDGHENVRRLRNIWGVMDKRQGIEILTGDYQTPIRDAWNYLLWTSPLTVRRTSTSIVSTTVAATFTLDVFPGGLTSWPSLTTTPPLATQPREPACIPATLIQPVLSMRAKRDNLVSVIKSVKPYVTRESTTVVVKIRDNYLETTSNVPTITQAIINTNVVSGALQALTSQTIIVETVAPDGSTQTLSVVVIKPSDTLGKDSEPAATIQRLGTPQETSVSLSGANKGDGTGSEDGGGGSGEGGRGGGGGESDEGGSGTRSNPADKHIQKLTDNQRVVSMHYTAASYFGAMYAPALTAIFVKILFEPMLAALKGMEPFERLHREQGATAEDSLCSQYLSSSLAWDTIRSIWTGSSIPLWTTIIYLMVSISAPLASASMTVRPMDECWMENSWKLCSPAWVIDIRFLRTLEALLVICIILTLVLLWSSWKYHAGIPTNPTSIASVAVLLNYESLRQDLQAIDPEATSEELERALEDYHFWLIPHTPSRTESRYGFVHAQTSNTLPTPDTPNLPTFLAKCETRYNRLRPHLHPHHTIRLTDSIHMFTTLALLAILTTYRANTNNDKFNYFFASNTFWPKFILVALATSLDMQWKSLEREVRITEPYRRLYLGHARPENTILRSLNGTCWSNLPRAWRDLFRYTHMWFEALVVMTAIASDINIIAVSGVLMTYSQTRTAYQWSSITALLTTSFMFSVPLIVVFWWRRTEAISTMPRTPETVAAVLSYLCISRMAVDLANMGLENASKEERDRIIVSRGRKYRFGRMLGEDGKERYCVDYEDDEDGNGDGERDSWLQAKMERPVPVRLSSSRS